MGVLIMCILYRCACIVPLEVVIFLFIAMEGKYKAKHVKKSSKLLAKKRGGGVEYEERTSIIIAIIIIIFSLHVTKVKICAILCISVCFFYPGVGEENQITTVVCNFFFFSPFFLRS